MATILQVNTIAVNGSTGRITEGIGEAAKKNGHQSYIAYGRNNPSTSKSNLIRIGNEYDVWEHVFETRIFDMQGLASRNATKKFILEIESIRPDIIHLHNLHGNYINYKILFDYLEKKNIPVVWTLHDCWAFTGHCVHFTDVNCDKWKNDSQIHCCNCPKKKGYPNSYVLDRSKKNFLEKKESFTKLKKLTIVTVSYWLAEVTAESFLGKYPIRIIQNGIDINTFYPRLDAEKRVRDKYSIGDRFIILGVATGWSEDVGLSVFCSLRDSLSDNYSIVMVGLTEEQLKTLPKGIIGIRRTNNQDELAEIYTAADVFFNGSFQETFGLVTAEAMACGTPVIVYDSTACPEIVNEERGRIIPVGDFDRLISAIQSLEGLSYEEKENMFTSCVEYVRSHLDKGHKCQEYINLYNALLKNE